MSTLFRHSLPALYAGLAWWTVGACTDAGFTPLDSGFDTDVIDTDTDVVDTDTDVVDTDPPPPREGCEAGALDEGWTFTVATSGWVSIRAFGGGEILAASGGWWGSRGAIYLLSVEEWQAGEPAWDTRTIGPSTRVEGAGRLLQAPLRLADDKDHGFALSVRHSEDASTLNVWNAWPEAGTTLDDADLAISFQGSSHAPSAADFDGDGLHDFYLTGPAGVLLSPLSGNVRATDAEPNIATANFSPAAYPDWNDDGYQDIVIGGQAYLGPLYGRAPGSPPDLTFDPLWANNLGDASPPQDLDGDGLLEVWIMDVERQTYQRMNYPGPGVHDSADHVQIGFVAPAGTTVMPPPLTGDFNGDGYGDMLVHYDTTQAPWVGQLSMLAGPLTELDTPLPPGLVRPHNWADSVFTNLIYLGDIDGDGRDDFAQPDTAYDELDRSQSQLWLGCPDW